MRARIVLLALLASLPLRAFAQQGGMPPMSASELAQAAAACDQLAGMPNPPMSVASCKSMVGMASRMQAAANDPSARRPGDESMTCAELFAELRTMAGVGISEGNRQRAEAAGKESAALQARQTAEMGAFVAETYALGAMAGAVGAFTPNFVGAAIAAAWQAQAIGFAAKQAAEQAPVRARMNEALAASMDELSQSLQANPRFARVGQLAVDKDCQAPAEAPR